MRTKIDIKELIGKKIVDAEIIGIYEDYFGKPVEENYDDRPILRLIMEDGEIFEVESNYGGYTGNSEDEYPRFIKLMKKKE